MTALKISVMFKNEHQINDPLNGNDPVLEVAFREDRIHQPISELVREIFTGTKVGRVL